MSRFVSHLGRPGVEADEIQGQEARGPRVIPAPEKSTSNFCLCRLLLSLFIRFSQFVMAHALPPASVRDVSVMYRHHHQPR